MSTVAPLPNASEEPVLNPTDHAAQHATFLAREVEDLEDFPAHVLAKVCWVRNDGTREWLDETLTEAACRLLHLATVARHARKAKPSMTTVQETHGE